MYILSFDVQLNPELTTLQVLYGIGRVTKISHLVTTGQNQKVVQRFDFGKSIFHNMIIRLN